MIIILENEDFIFWKSLKEFNQTPDSVWLTDGERNLEVRQEDGQRLWYVQNPETSEYTRFGSLSDKDYQLPAGTKAKGEIQGDLFTTAKLEINHPNLSSDAPVIVGNMTKYPMAGVQSKGENQTIVLSEKVDVTPQPIIRINGKKLGQLDRDAVALFQSKNAYNNRSLTVSLTSYGSNNSRELIATTPKGTSFKIEKSHFLGEGDLRTQDFNGETLTLDLSLEKPKNNSLLVNIKQEDGTLLPIGEFTKTPGGKASRETLTKAGLYQEGASFEAKITSRVTAARIELDPSTLEYPQVGHWRSTEPVPLDETTQQFVNLLRAHRPILSCSQQEWQLGTGEIKSLPTLGITECHEDKPRAPAINREKSHHDLNVGET